MKMIIKKAEALIFLTVLSFSIISIKTIDVRGTCVQIQDSFELFQTDKYVNNKKSNLFTFVYLKSTKRSSNFGGRNSSTINRIRLRFSKIKKSKGDTKRLKKISILIQQYKMFLSRLK